MTSCSANQDFKLLLFTYLFIYLFNPTEFSNFFFPPGSKLLPVPVPAGSRSQPTTTQWRSHPCGCPQQTGNGLFFFLCSESRIEKSVQQIFPEGLYLFLVCPLAVIAQLVVLQSSRLPGWSRFGCNPLGTEGELCPRVGVAEGSGGQRVKPKPALLQHFCLGRGRKAAALPISPASIQEGSGGRGGDGQGPTGWLLSRFVAVCFLSSMGAACKAKSPPDSYSA